MWSGVAGAAAAHLRAAGATSCTGRCPPPQGAAHHPHVMVAVAAATEAGGQAGAMLLRAAALHQRLLPAGGRVLGAARHHAPMAALPTASRRTDRWHLF